MPGVFVVSLDFELRWEVLYRRGGVADYDANVLGVRQAIPAMLDLFHDYEIHATWATVGLLFFSNKEDLLLSCPQVLESADSTKVVTCAAFALPPPSDFLPRQPRRNTEDVVIPFPTPHACEALLQV